MHHVIQAKLSAKNKQNHTSLGPKFKRKLQANLATYCAKQHSNIAEKTTDNIHVILSAHAQ